MRLIHRNSKQRKCAKLGKKKEVAAFPNFLSSLILGNESPLKLIRGLSLPYQLLIWLFGTKKVAVLPIASATSSGLV